MNRTLSRGHTFRYNPATPPVFSMSRHTLSFRRHLQWQPLSFRYSPTPLHRNVCLTTRASLSRHNRTAATMPNARFCFHRHNAPHRSSRSGYVQTPSVRHCLCYKPGYWSQRCPSLLHKRYRHCYILWQAHRYTSVSEAGRFHFFRYIPCWLERCRFHKPFPSLRQALCRHRPSSRLCLSVFQNRDRSGRLSMRQVL